MPRLLPPGLYGLCDDAVRPDLPVERQAALLLSGGVQVVQLRLKRTPAREAVAACRAAVALCRAAGARCLVNDRVDWALLCGADGVHLGDEDVPPEDARRLLGPSRIIGVTARSVEACRAAARAGADYAGVGPVFPTSTKHVEAEVLGLSRLEDIAGHSPVPVVAISGIGLDNIDQVAAAGAHMAAVVSDLLRAADIPSRARELARRFDAGRTRRTL
ncbi:MAG TPA: thiamine phosphate synthase [Myxococcales bacterium]|jgi:thiamine-phosphate pyrophosphorylase|nr:thiamine phosphate synthase [Myxococcales bacterium]